jgi:hypothetical protein
MHEAMHVFFIKTEKLHPLFPPSFLSLCYSNRKSSRVCRPKPPPFPPAMPVERGGGAVPAAVVLGVVACLVQ